MKSSQYLGLIASQVMRKRTAVNPAEIQKLSNDIETNIKKLKHLMPDPQPQRGNRVR